MSDEFSRVFAALSDRYTIEREVGRGGMATVYLAEDLKHGRQVAIKVLHPDIAASLGRERFLREIEIVANLRHAGILPLYDSGEADGLLYYVMPFVEGPSLQDRLDKEKQLPVEEALRITSELAIALDEAHENGVIHRDIKPGNVLFEGDQPLIADFGVATALEEAGGEKLTRTGVAVGTPSYMSPEQAAGGEADARSDEYALACVLYEMLGGTPPFTGPTPQAVMARHALDPVPDLGTVRSTVPEGVIAAVERAMAKVPADRYPSAGAFAEALAKGEERRRRPAPRSWRWEYAIGALVVAAGAVYLLSNRSEATDTASRRLAVLPFDINEGALPDTVLALELFIEVADRLRESGAQTLSSRAVRHYRNPDTAFDEVREDLSPDVVFLTRLEGRGDSLYVAAELVDAGTRVSLDATSIIVSVAALAEVVPRLVAWASRALQLSHATPGYEADPEARRLFARARTAWWNWEQVTADSLIEKALGIDPEYPEALGLSALLTLQWTHDNEHPRPCDLNAAWVPVAKLTAERALEFDSALVRPRVVLGHAMWEHELDWAGAEEAFVSALGIDPDHPDANLLYGTYLMTAGRMEAAWEHMVRASSSNLREWGYQGVVHLLARQVGQLEHSEEMLREAQIRMGMESPATELLIVNLRDQGRLDEAIQLFLETGGDTVAAPLDDDPYWAVARGNHEAVDRHIAKRLEDGSPTRAANVAYADGRYDLAMQYLEEWWPDELECPSRGSAWLLANFPELVDRPRFQEMMDVAGIPWRSSEVWAERSP